MAKTGAWRIPASYRYALDLDDAQFAWEFLRRNPAFRADMDRRAEEDPALGIAPRDPDTSEANPENDDGPSDPDPPPVTGEGARRAATLARWGLTFRPELAAPGGRNARDFLAA